MATITIENVPEKTIKRIGKRVEFSEVSISKKRVIKDPTIRLHALSIDPENTSYGPFDTAEDFLKHLHANTV